MTLWEVASKPPVGFDRRANVGLHHLALRVRSEDELNALHERAKAWPETAIEFAPQLSGKGPKVHFIMSEPGGLRIEFCYDPHLASA